MRQMFQYKLDHGGEIWLCQKCKKGKNKVILTHCLPLVDKRDSGEIQCDECVKASCGAERKSRFDPYTRPSFW